MQLPLLRNRRTNLQHPGTDDRNIYLCGVGLHRLSKNCVRVDPPELTELHGVWIGVAPSILNVFATRQCSPNQIKTTVALPAPTR